MEKFPQIEEIHAEEEVDRERDHAQRTKQRELKLQHSSRERGQHLMFGKKKKKKM